MILPVAILAGGLATRLHPITEKYPKTLLDINGRPFAEYQLDLLQKAGVRKVVYCLGHYGNLVKDTLGDGNRWGIEIDYIFDGPKLLGTGGALLQAVPVLGEAFFVMYGDSYLECDYQAVEEAFFLSGKLALMTVFQNSGRWDKSNVLFRNGTLLQYSKTRYIPEMKYIDYGLGAFHSKAWKDYSTGRQFDLSQVFQDLLLKDQLAGYEVNDRFYEIGSNSGLEETRRYLLTKGK
jgi:MurNAc alpha-1-phosphate uridylyltransferase